MAQKYESQTSNRHRTCNVCTTQTDRRTCLWNHETGNGLQTIPFEGARKPAYKIRIDFGDLGIRKSSAQLTRLYHIDDPMDKQVVAVVNFPPKQIGTFMSECLILGAFGNGNEVTLLQPERNVRNGSRIG